MKIVIIESPFRATEKRDKRIRLALAIGAMEYALRSGYAPFASHLLYTMPLDDSVQEDRQLGIRAGLNYAGERWFITDLGWSDGMRRALSACYDNGWPYRDVILDQVNPGWSVRIDSKRVKHLAKAVYW
jgi:hypothetical protein